MTSFLRNYIWVIAAFVIASAIVCFVALDRYETFIRDRIQNEYPLPVIVQNGKNSCTQIHWIYIMTNKSKLACIKGNVKQISCSRTKTCAVLLVPNTLRGETLRGVSRMFPPTAIYKVAAGSRVLRNIVKADPNVFHQNIALSPDGRRIALARIQVKPLPHKRSLQVITINGDLTGTQDLQPNEYVSAIRWSPDGNRLAVSMYALNVSTTGLRRNRRLLVFDKNLSNCRSLSASPTPDAAMAWSPDNSRIVYSASTLSGTLKILVEDVMTNRTMTLWQEMNPSYYVSHIEWLPNAVLVLLQSSNGGGSVRLLNISPQSGTTRYSLHIENAKQAVLFGNGIVSYQVGRKAVWFRIPIVSGL